MQVFLKNIPKEKHFFSFLPAEISAKYIFFKVGELHTSFHFLCTAYKNE